MKIRVFETGTVQIKTRQVVAVASGARRRLDTLLDKEWTEPLPILCWLIEHDEGLLLIDTGETARASEPGYYPRWHPYFRSGVRFQIEPEQEIGAQLRSEGIDSAEVGTVVLTHLHTDHAGGLHAFERSRILVSGEELGRAAGLRGRLAGYPNRQWPRWLAPERLSFAEASYGAFAGAAFLTRDGAVRAVPTPGHTRGHISVVVQDDDEDFFIAGDASYTQANMLAGCVDGVAPNEREAADTLARIRQHVEKKPTIYLPTHDPESRKRLGERRAIGALETIKGGSAQ